MNITSDPNLWAICALVFLLGLLIGVFLTAGGRRKWKTRYNSEVDRRKELEKAHADRAQQARKSGKRNGASAISLRAAAVEGPRGGPATL